jgi:hypothetical protein
MDDTANDPSPTIFPKAPSDRDKAMINKMLKDAFSYPPARKRKPSRAQKQRQLAKKRKQRKTIE